MFMIDVKDATMPIILCTKKYKIHFYLISKKVQKLLGLYIPYLS